MKKVFVIIACAALVLACGGNAAKNNECKGNKAECTMEHSHGECTDCASELKHGECTDCTGDHNHGECGDCTGEHEHKCNH